MFFDKLYVRIWMAVVFAVAVLTLLVGWAWRMTAEPPLREVVVRNAAGDVIGAGRMRLGRYADGPSYRGIAPAAPVSSTDTDKDDAEPETNSRFGKGPEFLVQMQDGQTVHMHMPRPPGSSWKAPFGFFWTLGLVSVAVALGTYPIVRRLTRRLEILQRGVEQWGDGNLSVRVPEGGADEVGFLANRFNHAAQQIEALVTSREALLASQKSLLANASHELRSPLTRIRMGLELMGPSISSAKDEIARNIAELDQLIDEILLASRLDAQESDLGTVESVDLVGLAAEECARHRVQLDVHLEANGALVVPGVAKLLRRAVRNLLENARRYGVKDGDGDVVLTLFSQGDEAVIQVSDSGPGVPESFKERIFDPFYRLPGASERDGGVGLGLALVKSIALRHGGSVKCSNRVGSGACFEVRLPQKS